MNKDRLLTLAQHLRTVKTDTFDLGTWNCGTTACAVGHACTIPDLKLDGLGLSSCLPYPHAPYHPTYLNLHGWNAVKEFFDLSFADAKYLFDNESYDFKNTSAIAVSDRIMNFIEQGLS